MTLTDNKLSRLARARFRPFIGLTSLVTVLVLTGAHYAYAQQSEDEHAAHHPPGATATTQGASQNPASAVTATQNAIPAENGQAMPPSMPSQSGQGMQEMMGGMMGPGQKQVFPSLMDRPDMSPERRGEVQRLAEDRIHSGTIQLQDAEEQLAIAIQAGNHDGAARAIQSAREALGQLESGVAAHRLLREGTPPQNTALLWLKKSMGLSTDARATHGFFGLSWFHYLAMIFLVACVLSMLVLYYFKTRRAAALVNQLTSGKWLAGQSTDGVTASPNTNQVQLDALGIHQDIAPSKPNSWTGALLVGRIFHETPYVKTFRLVEPLGGKLPFIYLPGQFLTFTVSPHGQPIKRSYTISSSPTHRDYCEVTVRHEEQGVVSSYLNKFVHEGELLQVTAPSGKFTFIGDDASSIVLIAGGVGVTPMMSVIRYLTDRSWPGDIYFIYGCKSDDDVIFREEIEYMARRFSSLHVTLVVDRADSGTWPHAVGRISKEVLQAAVPDLTMRHIHLCGPKPMMEAVKTMLAELNVPANQVETEVFVGKEISQPTEEANSAVTQKFAVTFSRSHKTAPISDTKTVLEAAEDVGVNIEYSCRSGTCGVCKVKLLSGAVTMEVEDGLESSDKAQNVILACQAKPTSDISVEA